MKLDAVVLGGGKLKSGQAKASIKLGEKTLIDLVVNTLRDCSDISKVIVTSVPKGYKPEAAVDDLIEDTGDLIENIVLAIDKAKGDYVLLVSSDIPLLEAKHVSEFVKLCSRIKGDIYYPLIPKSAMGRLGSMKRTYFKLDRTDFTGGNIMLIRKELWQANADNARQVFANRKSPLKLARLVGAMFIIKLALGRLSVEEVEHKTSNILGGLVKGVIIRHPEIGSDIDKEEDLQFMQTFFTASAAGSRRTNE